jgi:hypothetical protein
VFSDCHDVTGADTLKGSINRTFTAPSVPGIYYITQVGSWEFSCYGRGAGYNFDNNNANNAIAVLIVQDNNTAETIVAATAANANSPIGTYPITLIGCNSANYDITYQEGTLTVTGSRTASQRVGTITQQKEDGIKTPEESVAKTFLAPNPATSSIKVQVGSKVAGTNQLTLIDMLGRVQRIKSIKQLSAKSFELDVSNLPKGVYFIKVKTEGSDETFRFMKL